MTEKEFLKEFDSSQYEKPSVTVDALVITMNEEKRLEVLLIKRNAHPYENCWSLPGSFVGIRESLEIAVARGLEQKTGLKDMYLEQLYTFGDPGRDPRMRIISVAYMALVPKCKIRLHETPEVTMFEILQTDKELVLRNQELKIEIPVSELAFDHANELLLALDRLKGKVEYTDIALELLSDKSNFTIYELKMIHEAILNETLDTGNFRRSFKKKYIDTGKVVETGNESKEFSKKPSSTFKMIQ